MSRDNAVRSVLVTGAGGNLGRKLIAHLLTGNWCKRIVALDRTASSRDASEDRVHWIEADLADPGDRRWHEALTGIDAAVHFAARNPYPDASWSDGCASLDMTLAVLAATRQAHLKRVVFASSNHVMGRYKDSPLADDLAPGSLTTALPPGPGTRWFNGTKMVEGVAYAASKLMGERACLAEAQGSNGELSAVCIRIGWCQPGENRPDTINTSGLPGEDTTIGPDTERDLRWFRAMWLSNRDFNHLMEGALLADPGPWPQPGIVVNGMSANRHMPWDIETTRRLIGYEPQDDSYDHVA